MNFAGLGINDMELEHVLGDIQANARKLGGELQNGASKSEWLRTPPLWHIDAISARPHPQVAGGLTSTAAVSAGDP